MASSQQGSRGVRIAHGASRQGGPPRAGGRGKMQCCVERFASSPACRRRRCSQRRRPTTCRSSRRRHLPDRPRRRHRPSIRPDVRLTAPFSAELSLRCADRRRAQGSIMNRRTLLKAAVGGAAIMSMPVIGTFAAPALPYPRDEGHRGQRPGGHRLFPLTRAGRQAGPRLRCRHRFRRGSRNTLGEETIVHWHRLTPLAAGWRARRADAAAQGRRAAVVPLSRQQRRRTHWMHAHTLQEQNLLAAPLIVRRPEEGGGRRAGDHRPAARLLVHARRPSCWRNWRAARRLVTPCRAWATTWGA